MTVAELIDKLRSYDKQKRVMIEGYEYGLEDFNTLLESKVSLNYRDDPEFGGLHEAGVEQGFEIIDAVILVRKS